MSPLAVDANVYYEAAKKLTDLAHEIGTAVTRDLAPGLTSTAGMGGNYPAVVAWCTAYYMHASELRTVVQTYAGALRHFGEILNSAGYNWDMAEYNADLNPDKGAAPSHPVRTGVGVGGGVSFPEIPVAIADNGAGMVITSAGQGANSRRGTPNGRADALATAGTAWHGFANSYELAGASAALQAVRDSFTGVQAPEAPDIQDALAALRGGAEQIRTVAMALASAVQAHRDDLLDARHHLASAAAGAFPDHPDAQVTATSDNTSVNISVTADLSAEDIAEAEGVLDAAARGTTLFTVLGSVGVGNRGFVDSNALNSLAALKALNELPLLVETGDQNSNSALIDDLKNMATWNAPPPTLTAVDPSALDAYGPQMKAWAILSVKYGNEAGVDPRLVLAMALQEGAPLRSGLGSYFYEDLSGGPSTYHPREGGMGVGPLYDIFRTGTTDLREWKEGRPDGVGNSIGLTNMKEIQFDEMKQKYPAQFEGQEWSDLIGNDELALKATAYNLRLLTDDAASHATADVRASQPLNQFLSSSYNALGVVDRSRSVAEEGGLFTKEEVEHGESTAKPGGTFELADRILRGTGAYR
ncbi:hypothetical protein ACFU44_06405 [Nocardia rhizosphaerihabitans]|uniref:hypothetical protein n=1 Tax=Nocardia rhizosphaerihabitans TaxID=1691570 RepID=UPI00366E8097